MPLPWIIRIANLCKFYCSPSKSTALWSKRLPFTTTFLSSYLWINFKNLIFAYHYLLQINRFLDQHIFLKINQNFVISCCCKERVFFFCNRKIWNNHHFSMRLKCVEIFEYNIFSVNATEMKKKCCV